MNEREWIIEERMSPAEFEQARSYLMETLDRNISYYKSDLNATAGFRRDHAENAMKEIALQRNILALRSRYQEWTPVFLFRKFEVEVIGRSIVGYQASQVARLCPFSKPYTTTLERCVELWREVEGILKNKQLRIRNVYTEETIPCEMFG